MSDTVTSVEKHGTQSVVDQGEVGKLLLTGGGDRYEVEWDAEARVTPMGSLVFFAQYLQTGGLMDRLCAGTPLAYSSNNAPKERDVLGTIVLSILNGQTRYAHINALRGDRVGADVLGVSKLVSEEIMLEAEKRNQCYLFKLRQTTKVRRQIRELECDAQAWSDAGDGWQGAESDLKLMGWTRSRRCVFLRRRAQRGPARKALPATTEAEFDFVEHLKSGPDYEYVVLVTNDTLPIVALAQLYRDRADCENVSD